MREAAGDDQFSDLAFLLETRDVEYRLDGFFLRRTDKAAGVDQNHVGSRGLLDHLVAVILQQARHDLGVHQIARATEAHDAEFFIWSVHCPNSTTSAPCGISILNRSSVSPTPLRMAEKRNVVKLFAASRTLTQRMSGEVLPTPRRISL